MAETREVLSYPILGGEGGGDQGATAKPSGSQASPEAASHLRPSGVDPSRGPTTDTLGDALPREMTRVRKLIPLYRSVPMGFLAAGMMERSLDEAQRALAEGDTVAMIRCYQDLKEYET